MKRSVSLFGLVVLLMSLLAACGGAPTTPATTAPVSPATAAPAPTAAAAATAAKTVVPTAAATAAKTVVPTAAATMAATAAATASAGSATSKAVTMAAYISEMGTKLTPEMTKALGKVKIATQSPLSGDSANLGTGIRNGAQLAVEQASTALKATGLTFELMPMDDQGKAEIGSTNAKNIVSDPEVMCVVGHLNSGVALAALPDYKNANLPMVSPANTNPKITEGGYGVAFRVVGRDDVQGTVGEQFAREDLGVKSVYIIHDTTAYGQGVAEFFRQAAEKNGVKVLGFEGTEEKSDFSAILTPIQAANPDLIYFGGLYGQAGPLFRQARDRGITSKFLGPDGLDSADLPKLAGDAIEGMNYTSVAAPVSQFPAAAQFAKDYETANKGPATPFSAQAYDSANLCVSAIINATIEAKGKPTREQVLAAMKSLPNLGGITGDYKFNANGDPEEATYFVLKANVKDWNANELVKRLMIPAPASK